MGEGVNKLCVHIHNLVVGLLQKDHEILLYLLCWLHIDIICCHYTQRGQLSPKSSQNTSHIWLGFSDEVWDLFCVFKLWFILYLRQCSDVYTIMHSTVDWFLQCVVEERSSVFYMQGQNVGFSPHVRWSAYEMPCYCKTNWLKSSLNMLPRTWGYTSHTFMSTT